MKLTASNRTALVKLAGSLPKGSEERRAILAGLKKTAAPRTPRAVVDAVVDAFGDVSSKPAQFSSGDRRKMEQAAKELLSRGYVFDETGLEYIVHGDFNAIDDPDQHPPLALMSKLLDQFWSA